MFSTGTASRVKKAMVETIAIISVAGRVIGQTATSSISG
jgi:hypothetical protein